MNRLFITTLALFLGVTVYAQKGYQIEVNVKPFKNTYIYLAYYFGSKNALADSALVDDNGHGVFKGDTSLPGGIYFLVC
mgnify:FL=1